MYVCVYLREKGIVKNQAQTKPSEVCLFTSNLKANGLLA